MAKQNFDFSSLVPERDTFTDSDGQVYEFQGMTDFGVVDLAKISRVQRDIPITLDALAKSPDDEANASRFERLVTEALQIILPKMPLERMAEMTLGQKSKIFEFWTQRSRPEPAAVGEAPAGQPASP
jgi:hypothetical protein